MNASMIDIIIILLFTFYIIYDSYKVITKKQYKTTWFILCINLVLMFISIFTLYGIINPMLALPFYQTNLYDILSIILVLALLINLILKSNKFKR